ncbi:CHAT domain-containing protein [Romeria aff. gracilis LEGE 07310]|uniref:CHAT domain-containing protein n=1 Tax=Vasconcelosia minhoensis LEGE 07310 TaxID=915328 RepID=A0A8J7DCE1_9CYAN|nr:CHAT domain-containing protein [Romeria gracilis]MBE9077573.1 CHAT domain-containing protein [Romeria aff. gracilis LEGE 07310]
MREELQKMIGDRKYPSSKRRSFLRRLSYVLLSVAIALSIGLFRQPYPTAAAENSPTISQTSPEQLLQQGQDQYAIGQFTAAIQFWQQAAEAFAAQGNALQQAKAFSQIAIAFHQLADWSQANAYLAGSLELLEGRTDLPAERLSVLGQVYSTLGSVFLTRSQPREALNAFEQAASYYQQTGDSQGQLQAQINQAQALQALGFYRRALTALNELQPRLMAQSDEGLKSQGLRNLGNLLRITGDFRQSEVTLQEGLAIAPDNTQEIAATLYSLGQTAQALGNPDDALAYYRQTVAAAPTQTLQLQAQIAQFSLLQEADRTAASALLAEIQPQLAALPVSRFSVYAQLNLAHQLIETRAAAASPQIAQGLAIAIQQAKALSDPRAESFALGYLGELYIQRQQIEDAQTVLQQALTLAEQIEADDIAYQWQWQLGQLARQQGDEESAIAVYTSAVNTLQRLRLDLVTINPDLQFDFREQVEPVYRELVNLLLTSAQKSARLSDADSQDKLVKARDVIESLQLAELENFFREPCLAVQQQIDQVVDNANAPTAVMYPIILPDRIDVILKLPNQPLRSYSTPIAQAELEAKAEALRRQVLLPYGLRDVQTLAAEMYDWLLRPVEVEFADAQVETLVFVLDGVLRNIPMAVLYDGQQYLVEKYNLALAPGLKLVDPKPLTGQRLAAIAAGLSEARHGFSSLDYVRAEVEQIQAAVDSRVLLNDAFTQETLETAINQTPFPVVHLATHGQFSSNLEETFVLAWDTPISISTLSRLLRNSEQNRQDAIELLVLSACETAAGDSRAALGLAGVAARAGARSILASLWNLDDETSAVLMDQFYRSLSQSSTTKATALRQAQLSLLRNPGYEHPRYWAPYVLVGNWL